MRRRLSKEGMQHYLIVEWDGVWQDNYETKLFQYHSVPYFMSYEVREMNGTTALYYRLNYKTDVSSALSHLPLTTQRIKHIIESIAGVLSICEEYLLDSEKIQFSMEQVFMDVSTGRLQFCYLPDDNCEKSSLRDFLTYLLQAADRKQEEGMMILLQFYNMVTDSDCSLDKITAFCSRNEENCKHMEVGLSNDDNQSDKSYEDNILNNEKSRTYDKKQIIRKTLKIIMFIVSAGDIVLLAGLLCNMLTYEKMGFLFVGMAVLIALTIVYMQFDDEESPEQIMENFYMEQENNGVYRVNDDIEYYENSGFSTVMDDVYSGDTVLLSADNRDTLSRIADEKVHGKLYLESLVREQYAPIHINSESVVLGCMKEGCDYVLSAKGVSRMHAKLMEKADGMYILDLNSTNGTYINGEQIEAGKDYRLEEGDMVTFAGSQFFVSMESNI